MKKTEIEQERARLAGEVFEGAPDWVRWASMAQSGLWIRFSHKPILTESHWFYDPCRINWDVRVKNQPLTDLPWTETLIRRADYE